MWGQKAGMLLDLSKVLLMILRIFGWVSEARALAARSPGRARFLVPRLSRAGLGE